MSPRKRLYFRVGGLSGLIYPDSVNAFKNGFDKLSD